MYIHADIVFLGHIVGRTGLACDPATLAAVQNWHAPDKVKGVLVLCRVISTIC